MVLSAVRPVNDEENPVDNNAPDEEDGGAPIQPPDAEIGLPPNDDDAARRQVDAGGPVSGTHQKGYNKTGKRIVPTFNSEKASIASFRRGSPSLAPGHSAEP